MKLQQLQCVNEIVQCGFSVTRAAERLHQSQPGVSRHIRLLETELGVSIFVRREKKFVALTPIGEAIYATARRVLMETKNLTKLAAESKAETVGELTIATAPTHTRHSLPPVVERFTKLFPRVRLCLREGYGSQSATFVNSGDADVSISSFPVESFPDMVFLPCQKLHRIVITRPDHPLARRRRVTLAELAQHPILTYNSESLARVRIVEAFQGAGLSPDIVLSSYDADTIKRYVLSGLGIAIVAHNVFDPKEDKGLKAIDAAHLFGPTTVNVGLRRNSHLSKYLLTFIELFAPSLTPQTVLAAVDAHVQEDSH